MRSQNAFQEEIQQPGSVDLTLPSLPLRVETQNYSALSPKEAGVCGPRCVQEWKL